jgi:hypothetical protein
MNALHSTNANKATIDMVQNSNNILQKQSEILYENQKTLQEMVAKHNPRAPPQTKQIEDTITLKL